MTRYINKADVVAEIEKLREEEYPCDTFEESTGYYNALDEVSSFLNTLEVKDVDEIIKTAEDHAYFAGSEIALTRWNITQNVNRRKIRIN